MPDPAPSETPSATPVTPPVDPQAQVSIEVEGRVLTGVGVSEQSLQDAVDGASAPLEPPEPATPADTGPERLSRGQRRFKALTAEKEAAAAEAVAAKAERDRLAAELETYRRQAQPPTPPEVEARPAVPPHAPIARGPEPSGIRPRPSVNDIGTTYADWDAYVAADTQWVEDRFVAVEQATEAKIRAAIEQDRAQQAWSAKVSQIREAGTQLFPDFEAVVGASTVLFSAPTLHAIATDPDSPRLQYLLAKSPDVAARIAGMADPVQIGKAFAQLLGSASPVGSPASTGAGRPSAAPPPVQPVGSGARTTSPPLSELADKGEYEAYKARRHADLREVAHR